METWLITYLHPSISYEGRGSLEPIPTDIG